MERVITKVRKFISYSFVVVLLATMASCSSYRVVSYPDSDQKGLMELNSANHNYIVHQGDKMYILNDVEANTTSISGVLNPIGSNHVYYTANNNEKKIKSENKEISKEVHIYVDKNSQLQQGQTSISYDKVADVKYIKRDLRPFGWTIGALAVGVFVLMLTK